MVALGKSQLGLVEALAVEVVVVVTVAQVL
jgi:hypothetical protein